MDFVFPMLWVGDPRLFHAEYLLGAAGLQADDSFVDRGEGVADLEVVGSHHADEVDEPMPQMNISDCLWDSLFIGHCRSLERKEPPKEQRPLAAERFPGG